MTVETRSAVPQIGAQRSPRKSPRRRDASTAVIVYAIALFAIPSALVVAPLGAAGTPAQLMGVAMLAWWGASHLVRHSLPSVTNPVHWLTAAFAATLLTSYVAGMSRPITSLEVNSSDRVLIGLAAWCGVILVVSDGIRSTLRAWRVLQVIAGAAILLGALGVLQYFFNLDLAHYIKIPGLTASQTYGQSLARSGFRRVTATTGHPIEFGVVLAALLPLVMHCAIYAPKLGERRRWWAGAVVAGLALPLSVARSAFIGAGIALLIMLPTWPRRVRLRILAAVLVGGLAMTLAVPGLLGTIKSLFLNVSSDPSTQGRKDDYGPVAAYFEQDPLIGRGIGTFIPEIYRTLDNQFLGLLVETGLLGILAFLALIVGSISVAVSVRRSTTDAASRNLAQSLIAGIVVIGVNSATFDSFGFPICVGTLMLLIGLVGWLWADRRRRAVSRAHPSRRLLGVRPLTAMVALVTATCWVGAVYSVATSQTVWRSLTSLLMIPAQPPNADAFQSTPRADLVASVLHDALVDPSVRARVGDRARGRYEVAVGDGSLAMGTDRIGYGPILWIAADTPSPDESEALTRAIVDEANTKLRDWQQSEGVSTALIIKTQATVEPAFPTYGRRSRAAAGLAILTALLAATGLVARRERQLLVRSDKASDRGDVSS